ncbi:MAG: SEC-C metal-binding domain-containing protein, partial [Acidimicrobiales bacterium]
ALPDEIPIDSKMVSKAIERAQNTVEARNAEIRKDVLKYDEVMNEQRKVIYLRRAQILEGEDLRARTIEVLSSAMDSIVTANCAGSEYLEDWNLDAMLTETRLYFPTTATKEQFAALPDSNAVYETLAAEAIAYYEQREETMPGGTDIMRALEREVMLQLIDQKWREHLSEMDYLREGINLRAMGQQDPLVAWQRDGYEMFGELMSGIDDDYVKIVMHAQVQVLEQVPVNGDANLAGAQYEAADNPVQGTSGLQRTLAAGPAPGEEVVFAGSEPNGSAHAPAGAGGGAGAGAAAAAEAPVIEKPKVRDSAFERAGRNDPCPCGSGKKFKFCHGR